MSQSRSLALLALSVGLALAACKPTEPTAPVAADPAIAPAAASSTTAPPATAADAAQCPHADFDTFLSHFGNDIALQEASVADPLSSESLDAAAEPEPRQVSRDIPLAEVEWPVMPDPATLSRQGRELKVTSQPDGSMQVQIRKPDTSDQQTYTFARKPCWQLQRVVDDSL